MKQGNIKKILVDENSITNNQNFEDTIFDLLTNNGEKIENDIIEMVLNTYRYDKLMKCIMNEVMKSNLNETNKKDILIGLITGDIEKDYDETKIVVKADRILDSNGELFENLMNVQSGNNDTISIDITETIEKAQKGNADAQNELANYYTFGLGVELNFDKAEELYKEAIKNGNKEAKGNLATIYQEQGRIEEWESILIELVKDGDQSAMYNLGAVYLKNPQKREKGIQLLEQLALAGDDNAIQRLGEYYLYTANDMNKAFEYFKRNNSIYTQKVLRYYLGYQDKSNADIKEATKASNYLLAKGNIEEKYNTDILNSLNGKEVLIVKSFKEAEQIEIDYEKYGAIAVNGDLYSISDYNKIREKINEFLNDIEENTGENEFDVFMSIYLKIISEIEYDHSSASTSNDKVKRVQNAYTHRNLIGALIDKKCVCAGYAKVLKELLEFRGIDSIDIENDNGTHVFNQVKINGNWYYADVTFDTENVNNGKNLQNCLLSKEDFPSGSSHEHNKANVFKTENSYPQDIVNNYFNKYKKDILLSEYKNNKMFNFTFVQNVIEKFKNGKIVEKIKEFFDR